MSCSGTGGIWEPEADDIDAALEKGNLKFSLDGYKLKGSWVLVRTRDRSGTSARQRGRNWLLIKHRDFWSGPVNITQLAPLSVKSEGDFDDILANDLPDLWITRRPATTAGGSARKLMQATIESAASKIIARRDKAARQKKGQRTTARKKPTR